MAVLKGLSAAALVALASCQAVACPEAEFEDIAAASSFAARVILSEQGSILPSADDEWGSPLYFYDAWVIDRIRGAGGKVRLISTQRIEAGEAFVLAGDCGSWCQEERGLFVSYSMPFSLSASVQLGGGSQFEAMGLAPDEYGINRLETPAGRTSFVPWGSVLRAVAGADAYLECRGRLDELLGSDAEGCGEMPGEDAQQACWEENSSARTVGLAECRR